MDLSKTVSAAFATIKRSLPNAIHAATYTLLSGNQAYDPATGETVGASSTYEIEVALLAYKTREDNTVTRTETGDQRMLVPYAALPITPSMEDIVTIRGETWRIVDHSLDPTLSALHTFRIRRAS